MPPSRPHLKMQVRVKIHLSILEGLKPAGVWQQTTQHLTDTLQVFLGSLSLKKNFFLKLRYATAHHD